MSATPKTVLLRGAGSDLTEFTAVALLARGAQVAIDDPERPEQARALASRLATAGHPGTVLELPAVAPGEDPVLAPFTALPALSGQAEAVLHLYLPDATTDSASVLGYPSRLRPMVTAAAEAMTVADIPGIIVNQFLLATLVADQPLGHAVVEARNGITGITRVACVRYGRHGIRVTGLQVGLLDLPALRTLGSARVNAATTPLGRWIAPEEVAATLTFLALDSGYITGQMLVLDGGMTSGVNGV